MRSAVSPSPPTAPAVVHNPGDANGDGRVNINDLTIVLAPTIRLAKRGPRATLPESGTVDINDLTIVLAHYNQTYGSSPVATPEPSSLALLAGSRRLCGVCHSAAGRCVSLIYRRLAKSSHGLNRALTFAGTMPVEIPPTAGTHPAPAERSA